MSIFVSIQILNDNLITNFLMFFSNRKILLEVDKILIEPSNSTSLKLNRNLANFSVLERIE